MALEGKFSNGPSAIVNPYFLPNFPFAKSVLNDDIFRTIVNLIPEDWLQWNDADETPDEIREIYFNFLKSRLEHSEIFLNEAKNARG